MHLRILRNSRHEESPSWPVSGRGHPASYLRGVEGARLCRADDGGCRGPGRHEPPGGLPAFESKAALAIAAIRFQMDRYPQEVAETGNLRDELLEFLERTSARATGIAAAFTLFSSEYFQETSSAPHDLRASLTAGNKGPLAAILARAVQRGEIAPSKLTPPIETLLGDLFRHHVIMTFSAPPPELRAAWIDDIFLPLVRTC